MGLTGPFSWREGVWQSFAEQHGHGSEMQRLSSPRWSKLERAGLDFGKGQVVNLLLQRGCAGVRGLWSLTEIVCLD